jgi:hypothetical protein
MPYTSCILIDHFFNNTVSMKKAFFLGLIFFSFHLNIYSQQTSDWLIDDSSYIAEIEEHPDSLVITNGLVQRVIKLSPNAATIALDELTTHTSMLRGVKPEAEITINGIQYPVGGLIGQPNYAFLRSDWIPTLQKDTTAWTFLSYEISMPKVPFGWKRNRHHQKSLDWPPKGMHLTMQYIPPQRSNLRDIIIEIHYECYDGLPVIAKWLVVINKGTGSITVDAFASEVLAATEFGSSVESREYNVSAPNIHVETDYAFSSMVANDANHHVVHWQADPDYHTQVNYQKTTPCLLKVSPEIGPAQILAPGDTLTTFRTFVLVHDTYDRERNGLAVRRMYRKIAPWTTENPLMMHARFADWERVKLAIDQTAEVGFEMVILTFGSGFEIENESSAYIAKMKKYAEYARSKGVEIGGYSLLASRSIDPGNNVLLPEGEKAVFGSSPCIESNWGQDYFRKLYQFYDKSGFTLLEHDGSYPGDYCLATDHPGHSGYADSRWNQYQTISNFYKWCREQGIYLNIPDYYYLTGGNKCGMGYRETNWSLPREEQVIHTRQNIFDGTWEKLVTMGWMFVPLTEYHGGGEAATIEPLNEHLDHYGLMMMSNLSAGVQACYRGPRLYDTEETKKMVKERVDWYKKHRDVLEGDLIHLRRADGRNLDYWLMVNPGGKEKGALVVFNPTKNDISKTIVVPLYYSGLSDFAHVFTEEGFLGEFALDRQYRVDLEVQVAAEGWQVYFFKHP